MLAGLAIAASVYVHAGDTYSQLAVQYGTTVSALESANGYSATDIPVGASLTIPSSGSYSPSGGSGNYTPVYHHSSYSGYSSPSSTASAYSGGSSFQRCVISRESGGDSQVMNGSGHYGLYQFDYSTWVSGGGSAADFGHASVAEQNSVFNSVYAARGSEPWGPSDGC